MGIYYNLPTIDYRGMSGINQSSLKHLKHSPKKFKYEIENRKITDNMLFGTRLHELVLTPQEFDYFITPKVIRRGKAWDEVLQQAQEAGYNQEQILFEEDYQTLKNCAHSVLNHKKASKIISRSKKEVSITWKDKETGLDCKARIDLIKHTKKGVLICDLKTCKNASYKSFANRVFSDDFMYYMQAAFYMDGYANNFSEDMNINFCFIAVDTDPPFNVAVYPISYRTFLVGQCEYKNLLNDYLELQKTDNWERDLNYGELLTIEPPRYFFS